MANLTQKKTDFITSVVQFSQSLLDLAITADEIAAFLTDNGFQAGGANVIADADCVDANQHLTAAQVNAVVTVASAVSSAMTAARRTTLRQANRKPVT